MTDFNDYLESAIRDWMSQGTDMPTAPGNIHIGLHTADPGEAPDGSTEVSAGDYSRLSTTAGTDWDATTNPTGFDNASTLPFSQATSDWGTITHVSLNDAATGGNYLASFALSSSVTINTNDTFEFDAGQLSFEIQ